MFKNQLLYKADRLFDGLGVVGWGKGGVWSGRFWILSLKYVRKTGNTILIYKKWEDYNAILFNARHIKD
jgi:hypothetical protein